MPQYVLSHDQSNTNIKKSPLAASLIPAFSKSPLHMLCMITWHLSIWAFSYVVPWNTAWTSSYLYNMKRTIVVDHCFISEIFRSTLDVIHLRKSIYDKYGYILLVWHIMFACTWWSLLTLESRASHTSQSDSFGYRVPDGYSILNELHLSGYTG